MIGLILGWTMIFWAWLVVGWNLFSALKIIVQTFAMEFDFLIFCIKNHSIHSIIKIIVQT